MVALDVDLDAWFARNQTVAAGANAASQGAMRYQGSVDGFLVYMDTYLLVANDWVLTIMLCLYLLAARSGRRPRR